MEVRLLGEVRAMMLGGDADIDKLVHMLELWQFVHHVVSRHALQRAEGDVTEGTKLNVMSSESQMSPTTLR